MQTKSHISAAALAAALLASPQFTLAQGIGLNLDLGIVAVDANVGLGGDKLLDVDAGLNVGGDKGIAVDAGVAVGGGQLVDVDAGANVGGRGGTGTSLVDVNANIGSGVKAPASTGSGSGTTATGPNGGRLIDLNVGPSGRSALAVDLDVLGNTSNTSRSGSSLINGDIRLGAIADREARADALLGLIGQPNLGSVDLDDAIDDRRVSIIAAAELLGTERLADIRAAILTDGEGRSELLSALTASVELGTILGRQGIDLSDVLAVQVAENGATQVIVLGGPVQVALLGNGGDLADLGIEDLAALDLDLLSDDELAELDLDLLPDELATAVNLRLLGNDGTLANLNIGDLASIDISLPPGGGTGPGNGGTDPGTGPGNGGADPGNGSTNPGTGSDNGGLPVGTLPPTRVGASFPIATLGCDIGTLALARGVDATPATIASARTLELVRIQGCKRILVDSDAVAIRASLAANPAIASALQANGVSLDKVIGATIQGGTLTLFIAPALG